MSELDEAFTSLARVMRLERSYRARPRLADVDEACALSRALLDVVVADDEDRPTLLGSSWTWHRRRYELTNRVADLDVALHAARDWSAEDEGTDGMLALGSMLQIRYERTGSPADLAEAGDIATRLIDRLAHDSGDRPAALTELANAHRMRFDNSGDLGDLTTAIGLLRDARRTAAPDDDYRFGILANLATALLARYTEIGTVADAAEAYEVGKKALALITDTTDEDHPKLITSLAEAAEALHERTGERRYLDEALTLATDAARRLHGSPAVVTALITLGSALSSSHEHAEPRRQPPAVRPWPRRTPPTPVARAVAALRLALATCPSDHPQRASVLAHLSQVLRIRGEHEVRRADLKEAVRRAREAIPHAGDGRDLARLRIVLGRALATRFTVTGRRANAVEAAESYHTTMDTPGAPTSMRVRAAHERADILLRANLDTDDALASYTAAVELLPVLAFRGAARADNEWRLRDQVSLSADAAACATSATRPEHAITLLERGRAVLWSALLDIRADLDQLTAVAPDLAKQLRSVGAALESSP